MCQWETQADAPALKVPVYFCVEVEATMGKASIPISQSWSRYAVMPKAYFHSTIDRHFQCRCICPYPDRSLAVQAKRRLRAVWEPFDVTIGKRIVRSA